MKKFKNYFLKLLFLLLTLTISISFNIKDKIQAKEIDDITKMLIVKVNSNVNDYLKYDDYVVISNNVNTNQPGTYLVTYKNITTNTIIEKRVVVVSDDVYAYLSVAGFMNQDYVYHFVDAKCANGNYSYLYHFKYPNYFGENYYLHVNEYETQLVVRGFNGEISTFDYIDNHYLGCGFENNVKDGDQDMFMFDIYDDKKSLITVESSGIDYANCVTLNNQFYFFHFHILN